MHGPKPRRPRPRPRRGAPESEKFRRRTAIALLAAMLLAVTIGGGSWMAFRLDRDAYQAQSDRIVGDVLATAKALQDDAEREEFSRTVIIPLLSKSLRAGTGSEGSEVVEAWDRALEAADRAKSLLAVRSPRDSLAKDVVITFDRVSRSSAHARARSRQVELDQQLVAELEEARLKMAFVNGWRLRHGFNAERLHGGIPQSGHRLRKAADGGDCRPSKAQAPSPSNRCGDRRLDIGGRR